MYVSKGKISLQTAETFNDMGYVYVLMENYLPAISEFKKGLNIMKSLNINSGDNYSIIKSNLKLSKSKMRKQKSIFRFFKKSEANISEL